MTSIKEYMDGILVYQGDSNETPENAANIYRNFIQLMHYDKGFEFERIGDDYRINFVNQGRKMTAVFETV